jgi:TctA family transporter
MSKAQFKRSRRRWLRAAVAAGMVAVLPAAGAERKAKKKYSKERVGYRDEPYQGRSCGQCILYAGHGECAIVEGEVSVTGWCVQWTPATMGRAGRVREA